MNHLRRYLLVFALFASGMLAFQALAASGSALMPCCMEACDGPPQCHLLGCLACAVPAIPPVESTAHRPDIRPVAPLALDPAAWSGPVAKVWTPPD